MCCGCAHNLTQAWLRTRRPTLLLLPTFTIPDASLRAGGQSKAGDRRSSCLRSYLSTLSRPAASARLRLPPPQAPRLMKCAMAMNAGGSANHDLQLDAFKHLISLTTRFPILRRLFLRSVSIAGVQVQERDVGALWPEQLQQPASLYLESPVVMHSHPGELLFDSPSPLSPSGSLLAYNQVDDPPPEPPAPWGPEYSDEWDFYRALAGTCLLESEVWSVVSRQGDGNEDEDELDGNAPAPADVDVLERLVSLLESAQSPISRALSIRYLIGVFENSSDALFPPVLRTPTPTTPSYAGVIHSPLSLFSASPHSPITPTSSPATPARQLLNRLSGALLVTLSAMDSPAMDVQGEKNVGVGYDYAGIDQLTESVLNLLSGGAESEDGIVLGLIFGRRSWLREKMPRMARLVYRERVVSPIPERRIGVPLTVPTPSPLSSEFDMEEGTLQTVVRLPDTRIGVPTIAAPTPSPLSSVFTQDDMEEATLETVVRVTTAVVAEVGPATADVPAYIPAQETLGLEPEAPAKPAEIIVVTGPEEFSLSPTKIIPIAVYHESFTPPPPPPPLPPATLSYQPMFIHGTNRPFIPPPPPPPLPLSIMIPNAPLPAPWPTPPANIQPAFFNGTRSRSSSVASRTTTRSRPSTPPLNIQTTSFSGTRSRSSSVASRTTTRSRRSPPPPLKLLPPSPRSPAVQSPSTRSPLSRSPASPSVPSPTSSSSPLSSTDSSPISPLFSSPPFPISAPTTPPASKTTSVSSSIEQPAPSIMSPSLPESPFEVPFEASPDSPTLGSPESDIVFAPARASIPGLNRALDSPERTPIPSPVPTPTSSALTLQIPRPLSSVMLQRLSLQPTPTPVTPSKWDIELNIWTRAQTEKKKSHDVLEDWQSGKGFLLDEPELAAAPARRMSSRESVLPIPAPRPFSAILNAALELDIAIPPPVPLIRLEDEDELLEETPEISACSKCAIDFKVHENENEPVVKFGSALFHPACFTCGKCSALLSSPAASHDPGLSSPSTSSSASTTSTPSTPPPDDPLLLVLTDADGTTPICVRCAYRCHSCNLPILEEALLVQNQAYHSECFRCRICHRGLALAPGDGDGDMSFTMTRRGACCMQCYHDMAAKARARAQSKLKRTKSPIPP
uniref:LIM zinc-binding domain-containing protein n=1 Tax=Mycena chlorophos TaxID=658473 RepID=A0ABQ0L6F6_MYCCL|nr:predicted protein [Mycena chlorophos]